MKKLFFLCSLFLGIGLTASAQNFIERIDIADGGSDLVQHSIAQFGDDYIVAGTQGPGSTGAGTEIRLLRITSTGSVVWSKNFDFGGTDAFVGSLVVGEEDQGIVLTGYVGVNNGPKDLLIAKIDGNGNLLAKLVLNEPLQPTRPGYQLYGTDIVQKANGDYLVVGTGSRIITANSPKYGFVLSVDNALNGVSGINFPRIYQAASGNPQINNSMNHITKVPANVSPNGQEMFLLNGTTTRANDQTPEGFMTLIDGSGVPLWLTSYNGRNGVYSGGMAVYNPADNLFYVSYPYIEGQLETLQVEFGSGTIVGAHFVYVPGGELRYFPLERAGA